MLAELNQLRTVERPKVVDEVAAAAAQGDRSENAEYIYGKKRLREIDRRTRFLEKRLDGLMQIDVDAPRDSEKVYFGAWVRVEDEDGNPRVLRIMGEDEIDLTLGFISYVSPIGRSLLGKSPGDVVIFRSPAGDREFTLTDVQYGPRFSA